MVVMEAGVGKIEIRKRGYSVVVLADMNPVIHHPSWYRQNNLFTGAQEEEAYQEDVVCTRNLSRFQLGGSQFTCVPGRYEILVDHRDAFGFALDTTYAVFELLEHTPVSAFGFNLHHHYAMDIAQPGARLAGHLGERFLGLPRGNDAKVAYSFVHNGQLFNTRIEPSVQDDCDLFITINAHVQIDEVVDANATVFDLKEVVEMRRWALDGALEFSNTIIQAFSGQEAP